LGRTKKPQQHRKTRRRVWRCKTDFRRPTVEKVDDRFDYGEVRVYAIGQVNGREITVVYTDENNEERRIISAWRSEPHERRFFWTNVEG
jgi:uncharacterized protein